MLIENEANGILAGVSDVERLAFQMERLKEDPHPAEKLSKNAVAVREKYMADNIAGQRLNIL